MASQKKESITPLEDPDLIELASIIVRRGLTHVSRKVDVKVDNRFIRFSGPEEAYPGSELIINISYRNLDEDGDVYMVATYIFCLDKIIRQIELFDSAEEPSPLSVYELQNALRDLNFFNFRY